MSYTVNCISVLGLCISVLGLELPAATALAILTVIWAEKKLLGPRTLSRLILRVKPVISVPDEQRFHEAEGHYG
jgi:hypothetical protein